MILKLTLALVAFVLQYILMHSHKIGKLHWEWVAAASFIIFAFGMYLSSNNCRLSNGLLRLWFAVSASACLVLPPAIYIAREWMAVPRSVLNTLTQDGASYAAEVIIASGGWIFAIALLWLYSRPRNRVHSDSQVARIGSSLRDVARQPGRTGH
jgi:hypothetical protein